MTGRDPPDPSDETLMVRFQGGDRAAFAVLVRRYQGPLYGFVQRQLRSAPVAEEVVQESFVRVVQHAVDFKEGSRFATWLYSITRNLCIDQARRNVLRRHPSLDQPGARDPDGPTLGERTPDAAANVERDAVGTELQLRIAAAVDTLPADQREVFLMREGSNLAFKEIAVITGVSENTVKSRMRYALERLQAALAEYEEFARALR